MTGGPPDQADGQALDVPSPCVQVCRLHAQARFCEGCGRSAREIARWGTAEDEERRAIRALAAERLAALAAGSAD